MKTERRHELETNQLADSIGHWADAVRPYVNTILAGILAVIVAAGVYVMAHRRSATETATAWNEYFLALGKFERLKLEDLGEAHPGTPVGWWSLCMAADLGLEEGSGRLFRDKMSAKDILQVAANHYHEVLGGTQDPTLLRRASFGLVRTHECLGEIKKAADEYQAIATKWPDTPFASAADKRAKDLKRLETKEFYDWFARQDIGKHLAPQTGPAGLKSPFNLDMLPDSPDQSGDDATPDADNPADAPAATTDDATTDGPSPGSESTGEKDAERGK